METEYSIQLTKFFDEGDADGVRKYVCDNSHLPGRQVNLKFAKEFEDIFQMRRCCPDDWAILKEMIAVCATTDDPGEFLPFCALRGFAAWYPRLAASEKVQVLGHILDAMKDSRWRMREAAAMAWQTAAMQMPGEMMDWLRQIQRDHPADLLVKRGIVAALADPPFLAQGQAHAHFGLEMCVSILDEVSIMNPQQYKTEDYKVLKKGLEYTFSVFIAAIPETGFAVLQEKLPSWNTQVHKIVRQNLKKTRLSGRYGQQTEQIAVLLKI